MSDTNQPDDGVKRVLAMIAKVRESAETKHQAEMKQFRLQHEKAGALRRKKEEK